MSSETFRDNDKASFTMRLMPVRKKRVVEPNRFRQARKGKGLSQQELADKLGLSKAAISGWERDQNDITMKNLRKVCRALGTTIAWMVNEEGPAPLTAGEHKLVEISRALDEEERRNLFQWVDVFIEQMRARAAGLPKDISKKAETSVSEGEGRRLR